MTLLEKFVETLLQLCSVNSAAEYPNSVEEVIDDKMAYRDATLAALNDFKNSGPWEGSLYFRRVKVQSLHESLCIIYNRNTRLTFGVPSKELSGNSQYDPKNDIITLRGRLSAVTFLHEFAHCLGKNEKDACKWSINLFKRVFPEQFEKCLQDKHMLIR